MSATGELSGTAEGVVRRLNLGDGSLLQLRHLGGYTEAVLYWYNRRTKPNRIERCSARFQSLSGAIKAALESARIPLDPEEISDYVRSTRWGDQWPN